MRGSGRGRGDEEGEKESPYPIQSTSTCIRPQPSFLSPPLKLSHHRRRSAVHGSPTYYSVPRFRFIVVEHCNSTIHSKIPSDQTVTDPSSPRERTNHQQYPAQPDTDRYIPTFDPFSYHSHCLTVTCPASSLHRSTVVNAQPQTLSDIYRSISRPGFQCTIESSLGGHCPLSSPVPLTVQILEPSIYPPFPPLHQSRTRPFFVHLVPDCGTGAYTQPFVFSSSVACPCGHSRGRGDVSVSIHPERMKPRCVIKVWLARTQTKEVITPFVCRRLRDHL